MTIADLKHVPCEKCGGNRGGTYGSSTQRTILYLTDRIIVRCNSCGDEITYMKKGALNGNG